MKDYLAARDVRQLPRYVKIAAFKPDPPNFVAEDKESLTAIELTELVSKEAIEANITASKLREKEGISTQPQQRFVSWRIYKW